MAWYFIYKTLKFDFHEETERKLLYLKSKQKNKIPGNKLNQVY